MPKPWTGEAVKRLHNNEITANELAKEMDITVTYLSYILNSKREPPRIEERVNKAIDSILEKRKAKEK